MNQTRGHLFALAAISLLILSAGCSERENIADLPVSQARIDPMVFDEKYDPINVLYGEDAYFQAFLGTDIYSLKVDSLFTSNGKLSIKVTVPPDGSAMGAYAGGVLTAVEGRDFADFNALTFKARTDTIPSIILDMAGFGNDNTGTSLYEAGRSGIPLTPEWTFIVIPIPAPSKLISERGLFTFADGWESPYTLGYDIWFDEIKFAKLDNITDPEPGMGYTRHKYFVGAKVTIGDGVTKFHLDGEEISVNHSPHYFDFTSSDPSVATVVGNEIQLIGDGYSRITAELEGVAATGYADLTVYLPPATAAVPPSLPAGDVISMFSDVYNDVPVDTWRTDWSLSGPVQDYVVAGDNTKMYTFSDREHYVGIEFVNPTIDATEMTHLHLDVYAPVGTEIKVKLGSFPNGSRPEDDHPESLELTLNGTSIPPFTPEGWVSLDIPLADFQITDDWDWANIGHLILSTALVGSTKTPLVLVDNVFWHK